MTMFIALIRYDYLLLLISIGKGVAEQLGDREQIKWFAYEEHLYRLAGGYKGN